MLKIKNLNVFIKEKPILNNINLNIKPGEIHAIMGPNGSGKSSLCYTIAGKKEYKITQGDISFKNKIITNASVEERANMGIFISFQYPIEIPGISIINFLKTSIEEMRKYKKLTKMTVREILQQIKLICKTLQINSKLLNRSFNENFSGGEKKKIEIFQSLMLNPELLILDELDSGLDIDALRIITKAINKNKNNNKSIIIITHYQRILKYITPDHVHILHDGTIIKQGDYKLANKIEEKGYKWLINK